MRSFLITISARNCHILVSGEDLVKKAVDILVDRFIKKEFHRFKEITVCGKF